MQILGFFVGITFVFFATFFTLVTLCKLRFSFACVLLCDALFFFFPAFREKFNEYNDK